MVHPKKFKFNVFQKKRTLPSFHPTCFKFGSWGLRLDGNLLVTSNFLFRINMFIKKATKRSEKTLRFFWLTSFTNQPLTRKAQGSRMGKGKGKRFTWGISIKPGILLYELKNVRNGRAAYYLTLLTRKFPVKCSVLVKSNFFARGSFIHFRYF